MCERYWTLPKKSRGSIGHVCVPPPHDRLNQLNPDLPRGFWRCPARRPSAEGYEEQAAATEGCRTASRKRLPVRWISLARETAAAIASQWINIEAMQARVDQKERKNTSGAHAVLIKERAPCHATIKLVSRQRSRPPG